MVFTAEVIHLDDYREVLFREVTMDSGPPLLNGCHDNVRRWLVEHPDDERVCGWLLLTEFCGLAAVVRHSVVRQTGQLVDITPVIGLPKRRFKPFQGPEAAFDVLDPVVTGYAG